MKVTALEEYGLRCLLLFADNGESQSLTLQEISNKEGLSLPYAGKLLMILKKAGLVEAIRGRKGGYVLSRPASEIKLQEVFSALGESLYGSHHCEKYSESDDVCVHSDDCKVGSLWDSFNTHIQSILTTVTLADVAEGKTELLVNLSETKKE